MNTRKYSAAAIAQVLLGNLLYALSVKLFLMPAGLLTGGTTGIALVLNRCMGLSVSGFVLIFNLLMLAVGWLVLGRAFALTTVLSTFSYPLWLELCTRLLGDAVLTEDLLLCAIFSGLGIGAALGIVIRAGASTGGMDIPPLVLNHFFGIPVSIGLYGFDFVILLAQAIVNPVEKVLYGLLLVMVYTIVMDKVILLGTSKTEVKIISNRSDEIRTAILSQVDRGVTLLYGQGGYLHQDTTVVLSVVSNRELPRVERLIHAIDPEAFLIVSRVSEVRGHGFSLRKAYR